MNNPGGLSSVNTTELKNILIESLKEKKSFAVFVFGSRSKNTFKKYSDVDLWIEADPSLSLREVTLLHENLEQSQLSVLVDIVTPESCLPAYLPQIQSEKKLWFTST